MTLALSRWHPATVRSHKKIDQSSEIGHFIATMSTMSHWKVEASMILIFFLLSMSNTRWQSKELCPGVFDPPNSWCIYSLHLFTYPPSPRHVSDPLTRGKSEVAAPWKFTNGNLYIYVYTRIYVYIFIEREERASYTWLGYLYLTHTYIYITTRHIYIYISGRGWSYAHMYVSIYLYIYILTDWLIDSLIDSLIDWFIDWLTDWLIHWLIHWLIDWLWIGFTYNGSFVSAHYTHLCLGRATGRSCTRSLRSCSCLGKVWRRGGKRWEKCGNIWEDPVFQ